MTVSDERSDPIPLAPGSLDTASRSARLGHLKALARSRWLLLLCVCAVAQLGYVFIASAGRFTHWPSYESRVDHLAEAFRAGQLHLLVQPPPELLAAPDPFDPKYVRSWYWDASLYKGRYYWYWGPVPALLLAAVKTVFRISRPLGDEYPTFALASLQLAAGAVLLERLARRLFRGLPMGIVALGVGAFALANPTPFLLARQAVYEAAIVGGHAFVLTGIALAFEAVFCAERARRSLAFAAAAGVAWALALGCRVSIAPFIPAVVIATALALGWRSERRWQHALKGLVAMGTPLLLGVGALLAYNKARFEQWFEFGQHYQLTWLDFRMSSAYVAANSYSYALRPPQLACQFPFVVSPRPTPELAFPAWLRPPEGYTMFEQVAGVLVTTPWVWLAAPALFVLGRILWRAARAKAPCDAVTVSTAWALLALLFASSLTFLLPLLAPGATMRYLGDAVGALLLFASLGAFATYSALRRAAVLRWLTIAALTAAALGSAAVGLALGVEGYYSHFRQHNVALLEKLERRWSFCAKP